MPGVRYPGTAPNPWAPGGPYWNPNEPQPGQPAPQPGQPAYQAPAPALPAPKPIIAANTTDRLNRAWAEWVNTGGSGNVADFIQHLRNLGWPTEEIAFVNSWTPPSTTAPGQPPGQQPGQQPGQTAWGAWQQWLIEESTRNYILAQRAYQTAEAESKQRRAQAAAELLSKPINIIALLNLLGKGAAEYNAIPTVSAISQGQLPYSTLAAYPSTPVPSQQDLIKKIMEAPVSTEPTVKPEAINLPLPQHVTLQQWNRMITPQQQALLSGFQAKGVRPEDVEEIIKGTAPYAPTRRPARLF